MSWNGVLMSSVTPKHMMKSFFLLAEESGFYEGKYSNVFHYIGDNIQIHIEINVFV